MAKYIDADKLKNTLKENIYPSNRSGKTFNSLLEFVISLIDDMPAADVVEVKHGKWIEEETYLDTYYDCSVCGESFCFIEGSPTDNLYKYCPNCGAKMDGERKQ